MVSVTIKDNITKHIDQLYIFLLFNEKFQSFMEKYLKKIKWSLVWFI